MVVGELFVDSCIYTDLTFCSTFIKKVEILPFLILLLILVFGWVQAFQAGDGVALPPAGDHIALPQAGDGAPLSLNLNLVKKLT